MGCMSPANLWGRQSKLSEWYASNSFRVEKDKTNFLGDYTYGKIIGRGAFGKVYECKKNGCDDFDYAVKVVGKVGTPVAEIRKEANLIKAMDHPNVVKFHAMYSEDRFVCIVMDRLRGGDLIDGMEAHWKLKGDIPIRVMELIVRQMIAAVEHLHSRNVCHRDIKGDNYLMDRPNLNDPGCKFILADFGTAVEVKQGQRLRSVVGSMSYWAPEFYARDYSFKVDCWAIGVVMFGLIEGRFPFKSEADTRFKTVRVARDVPEKAKQLLFGLLTRKEEDRLDAKAAMRHAISSHVEARQS